MPSRHLQNTSPDNKHLQEMDRLACLLDYARQAEQQKMMTVGSMQQEPGVANTQFFPLVIIQHFAQVLDHPLGCVIQMPEELLIAKSALMNICSPALSAPRMISHFFLGALQDNGYGGCMQANNSAKRKRHCTVEEEQAGEDGMDDEDNAGLPGGQSLEPTSKVSQIPGLTD